jgi:hypothetical protein
MKKISVLPIVIVAALMLLSTGCASLQPHGENSNYTASNIDRTQNAKAGVVLGFF